MGRISRVVNRINKGVFCDRCSYFIPVVGISHFFRHARVVAVLEHIAAVDLHGLDREAVCKERNGILRGEPRIGRADRHIALDGRSIPLPRAGVARLFGHGRVVAVLEGIALRNVHGLDSLSVGHKSNFISLNGAVSIPRNGLSRADAVCVVGEIQHILGRAVALGGSAAELAAVLPLHVPEQLRPVRVKRRVTAAVVLEVDAVDGRQQVAPPAVFVGVLVQLAHGALMVL